MLNRPFWEGALGGGFGTADFGVALAMGGFFCLALVCAGTIFLTGATVDLAGTLDGALVAAGVVRGLRKLGTPGSLGIVGLVDFFGSETTFLTGATVDLVGTLDGTLAAAGVA